MVIFLICQFDLMAKLKVKLCLRINLGSIKGFN
jgi:hypothetical protein